MTSAVCAGPASLGSVDLPAGTEDLAAEDIRIIDCRICFHFLPASTLRLAHVFLCKARRPSPDGGVSGDTTASTVTSVIQRPAPDLGSQTARENSIDRRMCARR